MEIVEGEDRVEVDGCWTYVWGARRRPFVHPLRTPAGHVLTVDAPADHPWHHGLWFTIKYVDGDNFWEEYDAYGVLRHTGPPAIDVHGDGDATTVSVSGSVDWIRPDRSSVAIRELRTWTYRRLDERTRALDLETALWPEAPTLLDRTPFTTWGGYGGLTFRGRPDLVDTVLRTPDGATHERRLGQPAPWLSLAGTVDGAPVGVAMLDHPSNPRHPTPWYASCRSDTYGDEGWSNFVNAALLWDEPLAVEPLDGLHLRHRVLVHDGEPDLDELADRWADWAEA